MNHKQTSNGVKKIRTITSLGVLLALLAILAGPFAQVANAAAITSASDTMSSSKAVTASSHKIKFTTPTGAADSTDTIIITFPSTGVTPFNFTSKTISTVTFTHGVTTGLESTETLAAVSSATAWGAVFSGTQNRILTLTAPTDGIGTAVVAASDKIILTYDSTNSINPSTDASPYAIAISGAFGDSGNISVVIVTDDQVAVSGTINQTLSFSLSVNSLVLGTLSTAAAVTGSHTMTFATNGTAGMSVTVAGTTLTSGANTIAACATGCTSSAGTAQFGINLVANTSPSVGAACSGTTPIGAAATNYNTANTFRYVSGETVANSTAAINSTTCTASYLTNIAGSTPAGSYTTALTYTATATF